MSDTLLEMTYPMTLSVYVVNAWAENNKFKGLVMSMAWCCSYFSLLSYFCLVSNHPTEFILVLMVS